MLVGQEILNKCSGCLRIGFDYLVHPRMVRTRTVSFLEMIQVTDT